MSKPTDINKATLEELTSITGIGKIRAQKMLKKKQENGSYLTLQDLKLMTDIPTTIWDPLMEAVEIRIESLSNPESGQKQETQPIDQNLIQKMANTIDILKTELDNLKQDQNNI